MTAAPTIATAVATPAGEHRPLQVIAVDLKSNEVSVNTDNLLIIQENLRRAGVDKVSVVSVMGAYRTGKSFLLDLFLRYLDFESQAESSNYGEDGGSGPQLPRETGTPCRVPAWLWNKKSMTESNLDWEKAAWEKLWAGDSATGNTASGSGFAWRGGSVKCTEGIWLYSRPFIKTVSVTENVSKNEDEEVWVKRKVKVGLLLMDTQGAFDSQTTKQQSATIFGLTTALSSKQLYNIQGRIGADHIEYLHYFAEMAMSACRTGGSASASSASGSWGWAASASVSPFQYLQLVVRDWANFDDETWEDAENRKKYGVLAEPTGERWSVGECEAQMKLHLDQHFGDEVKERESVDTLKEMYGSVSCWLFPSPGLKVAESKKRKWDGSLGEIDEDFLRFVDIFCKDLFNNDKMLTQKVLGEDLSVNSFVSVFETLTEWFSGMEVTQMSMVEAIGKAKNLVSKDEAEKMYKKYMDKTWVKKGGKDPELLHKDHAWWRGIALEIYDRAATFGDLEQIKEAKGWLEKQIGELFEYYKKDNERRLEQALSAFWGLAWFALLFFVLDRISDYACDWWLDTCVWMSKLFVFYYTSVIALLGYQFYLLVQERGRAAAGLAGIELTKQMYVTAEKQMANASYYAAHRDEFVTDSKKFYEEAKVFTTELIAKVQAGSAAVSGSGSGAGSSVGGSASSSGDSGWGVEMTAMGAGAGGGGKSPMVKKNTPSPNSKKDK